MQKTFACASAEKKTFKGYSNVPNVHLALHYLNDIENYGTARNSSTMMGEQKHKIFKIHASHTNSKDADLQLMKATNTLQTIRFLLDGTFARSAPAITQQLQGVVQMCPTLRTRFLGAKMFDARELEDLEQSSNSIDHSHSLFQNARIGRAITLKSVSITDSSYDVSALRSVYREEYGIELHPSTRLKVRYWGYFSGDPDVGVTRFNLKPNNIIRLRGEHCFHRVSRILAVTVGTVVRVFFVLVPIRRAPVQENRLAPYQVYQAADLELCTCIIVGIRRIDPTILHFVKKSEGNWWYNPYVPHFL